MKWNIGGLMGRVRRALTWESFGMLPPPRTIAGVPVTVQNAMGVSAVYCADRVISEGVGCLPLHVFKCDDDDVKERQRQHPLNALFWQPNPEMTGPVFWTVLQHHANIWGYKLAEIVRDGAGRPAQLWPIHPANCQITRPNGVLTFTVYDSLRRPTSIDPADLFFVPGHSPDGSIGYKLLDVARNTIGAAIAKDRFGAAVFGNGARPGGILTVNGKLSDKAQENLKASWRTLYGGPDQAGGVAVLEDGTKWEEFDMQHNQQLQLAELGEFYIDEVARFFNISPVKLHKLARATWANLETLNRDFATTTLRPWLLKDSAEADKKFFTRQERDDGYFCEHQIGELLRADIQTRYAAYAVALINGFLTQNEVRAMENLPPKDGGDMLRAPLNTGPVAPPATAAALPPKAEGS